MRHVLFLLAVLGGSVALALLLIPGGEELGLMYFKDKSYRAAQAAYERELRDRGLHPRVVVPLTHLHLLHGDVHLAIELARQLSLLYPNDPAMLELLASLYRDAQRPDDYLQTLHRLVEVAPDGERLREVALLHELRGRRADERAALALLHGRGEARADEHLRLARLQAAAGDSAIAAGTLIDLLRRPDADDPSGVLLLADLLLDQGEAQRATILAADWLARHPRPEVAVQLAALMQERGFRDEAIALLEAAGDDVEVALFRAQLRLQVGDAEGVLRDLLAQEREGGLPEGLRPVLVEAALAAGDDRLALDAAARGDRAALADWLLLGLADAALRIGELDRAARIYRELDVAALEARPLLAAHLALAAGADEDARRWLDAARTATLTPAEQMQAAGLLLRLGERDAAAGLLAGVDVGRLHGAELVDLAWLYHDLGAVERGLAALENERSGTRPYVWALLVTAAGREAEAMAWLRGPAGAAAGVAELDALAALAARRELRELAVLAARRALDMAADDVRRLQLAAALLAAGRGAQAVPLLREVGGSDDPRYRELLFAAHQSGVDVSGELAALLARLSAGDGLLAAGTVQLVHDLLAVGAGRVALPTLAALAEADGGTWYWTFRETALAHGGRERLVTHLRERLADAHGLAARRFVADELMTLGETGPAMEALHALSRSPALAPGERLEAWYALVDGARRHATTRALESRTRADLDDIRLAGDERAARLHTLAQLAGSAAVLPYLRGFARAGTAGDTEGALYAYEQTALESGRDAELVAFLQEELTRPALTLDARRLRLDMLARHDPRAALPLLREAARWRAGDEEEPFFWRYVETARQHDEPTSLRAFLAAELERPELPDAARERRLALLAEQAPAAALPFLRAAARWRPGSDDQEPGFWRYVETAREHDEPASLRAFLAAELERRELPDAARERRLALLAEQAPAAAMPFLRAAAAWTPASAADEPDFWRYVETARRAGRDDALVDFLAAELARPTLGEAARERRLELLAATDPAAALPYLADAAAWSPSSPADEPAFWRYAESARRAGEQGALATFLAAELERGGLSADAEARRLDLLAAVDPAAALPWLRARAAWSPSAGADETAFWQYRAAAERLGRREELVAFARDELARASLPREALARRVDLLLALGAGATALPRLRELAAADPARWRDTHLDLLTRLDRRDELVAVLEAVAGDAAVPRAARRAAAERLLATGARERSEAALQRLAEGETADGEALRLLAWLWGPRAPAEALAWLATRTAEASGEQRLAWATRLADGGAPGSAAALLAPHTLAADAPPATVTAWLQMLERAAEREPLRAAVLALLEAQRGDLRELAEVAERNDLAALAERAWRRLAAAPRPAPEALRALGFAAWADNRADDAARWLDRYLAQPGAADDWQARLALAENLAAGGRAPEAARECRRLLDRLPTSAAFEQRRARARCLRHVGRGARAVALYRDLLAERPTDRQLRADLADLLLQQGDTRAAAAVLAAR